MDNVNNGIIIKGIGGFYYVEAAETIYECKAKGVFRKNKITPLVGDRVTIQLDPNGYDCITEIQQRKNSLIRPPLANLDNLFIVMSVCKPNYSTLITDRMTAIAQYKNIEPYIVINKSDLLPDEAMSLQRIYTEAGFTVVKASAETGEGIEEIKSLLTGKTSAFTGNSGVGKSSLLNLIDDRLAITTGEISEKLGRGRHTTRHVELYRLEGGGYVADTPGFSSLDLERCEMIPKDQLAYSFRDFDDYLGECQFTSCAHVNDKGCAILKALKEGKIMPSRHESYCIMYDEVKNIKDYELKS